MNPVRRWGINRRPHGSSRSGLGRGRELLGQYRRRRWRVLLTIPGACRPPGWGLPFRGPAVSAGLALPGLGAEMLRELVGDVLPGVGVGRGLALAGDVGPGLGVLGV